MTREQIERFMLCPQMTVTELFELCDLAKAGLDAPKWEGWVLSIEGYAGLTNVLKDLKRNPVRTVGEASLEALVKAHAEATPLPTPPKEATNG